MAVPEHAYAISIACRRPNTLSGTRQLVAIFFEVAALVHHRNSPDAFSTVVDVPFHCTSVQLFSKTLVISVDDIRGILLPAWTNPPDADYCENPTRDHESKHIFTHTVLRMQH